MVYWTAVPRILFLTESKIFLMNLKCWNTHNDRNSIPQTSRQTVSHLSGYSIDYTNVMIRFCMFLFDSRYIECPLLLLKQEQKQLLRSFEKKGERNLMRAIRNIGLLTPKKERNATCFLAMVILQHRINFDYHIVEEHEIRFYLGHQVPMGQI